VFPTSDIVARLNWVIEEAARWGPAVPVALGFAVALIEAVILPLRLWAKGAWVLVIVLCGVAAVALLRGEQTASHGMAANQLAAETAALHGLWSQLDTLSGTLPPASGASSAEAFDTVDDALASLSAKVAGLNDQIAALKARSVGRSVDAATAVKLACAPGDDEAYAYANQLVDILKTAGWDANGPEQTANVLNGAAMGVGVLVRDPSAPDAAKILLAAFSEFDIPHQPGIAADYAIPDTATVELFVAKKP
jgi:hypothetical protein